MAVTGFEPLDLTYGILETVKMLEQGQIEIVNAYPRTVTREGNRIAQKIIHDTFEPCDRQWRGIGMIPMSGWKLRPEYRDFDAEIKFNVQDIQTRESGALYFRFDPAGTQKTQPMPCLWQTMHTAESIGGYHGLFRRRLRRILSLRGS